MNQEHSRPKKRKVVARYSEPVLAHMAKARLEAEGIPASIRDANTVGIQWLYAPAVGWVRVEVDEEHEKEANRILESEQEDDLDQEEWSRHAPPDRQCPRCGSEELRKTPYQPDPSMRIIFKLLPFSRPRTVVRCKNCGKTWKE